ncbi:hypothetical protein [Mangrovimicrobium sediminis]|uniref:hypothetical protein n=1 Tax=Mangrovimicrobium sediminis TaxID=2562682 RepID=UPI0014367B80|nr:hypothetical protein [Haliea sp. SAOS-164]
MTGKPRTRYAREITAVLVFKLLAIFALHSLYFGERAPHDPGAWLAPAPQAQEDLQ